MIHRFYLPLSLANVIALVTNSTQAETAPVQCFSSMLISVGPISLFFWVPFH